MKKQILIGMASTLFMSAALAAGGAKLSVEKFGRDLERRDSEVKAGAALRGIDLKNEKDSLTRALVTKLIKVEGSTGKMDLDVDSAELKSALDLTFDINVNGKSTKVPGLELARRLMGIRESLELVREKGVALDEAAAAKVQAQEQMLPILVKQLSALGVKAAGARPGGKTAEAIARDTRLYTKAVAEGVNALITGTAREISSYAEIGAKQMEIKAAKPKLMVDELFDQAMKAKYGDKAEAKKKELEDCV